MLTNLYDILPGLLCPVLAHTLFEGLYDRQVLALTVTIGVDRPVYQLTAFSRIIRTFLRPLEQRTNDLSKYLCRPTTILYQDDLMILC